MSNTLLLPSLEKKSSLMSDCTDRTGFGGLFVAMLHPENGDTSISEPGSEKEYTIYFSSQPKSLINKEGDVDSPQTS